jgi:hypothetical protein
VLLIVVGVQLLSLGLVADVVSRTYHESQGKRPYYVRNTITGSGHVPAGPPSGARASRDPFVNA